MYVHVHARRGMRAHRSLLNGHQEADQEGQLAGPVGGQGLYHCFVGETEWVSLLGSRDYGNKSIHINRESGGKGRLSAGCLVGQQCVCVCVFVCVWAWGSCKKYPLAEPPWIITRRQSLVVQNEAQIGTLSRGGSASLASVAEEGRVPLSGGEEGPLGPCRGGA